MNKITIVSPSSGMMANYPNRVLNGVSFLKSQNFEVSFSENAFKNSSYFSADIDDRINDIHRACKDRDTRIIMMAIGGNSSNQLLEKLDFELIRTSKKIFVGYSDITALLLPIYAMTGLEVLHGPSFLAEVCEYPNPYEYTWSNFLKALSGDPIQWNAPFECTTEFFDWALQENKPYQRKLRPDKGWEIIKEGSCKGILLGGNLRTMLNIVSTKYLPDSLFRDKILFIEETQCSIARMDSMLYSLKHRGVFENIAGLVFGKLDNDGKDEIDCRIKQILLELTAGKKYPVIANVDIGHTDPMLTIPVGRQAYLDCYKGAGISFGCFEKRN